MYFYNIISFDRKELSCPLIDLSFVLRVILLLFFFPSTLPSYELNRYGEFHLYRNYILKLDQKGTSGEAQFTQLTIEPGEGIDIEVKDFDLNYDEHTIQQIAVQIVNVSTNELEVFNLVETELNSGIFRNSLSTMAGQTQGTNSDGLLIVEAGHKIELKYEDSNPIRTVKDYLIVGSHVIDFEHVNDGYTASELTGDSFTDVFNRYDASNYKGGSLGGNSSFVWAVEDLPIEDPYLNLDQIDVSGATAFSFSIDLIAHHFKDWDSTDELLITYSLDGGEGENLMWIQMHSGTGNSSNGPAGLDILFDGDGDCGALTTLPSLSIGSEHGCEVMTDQFTTFSRSDIELNKNSTLDIKLQFNKLTATDEGIYLDNIVIAPFKVLDLISPVIIGGSPADEDVNITLSQDLKINFNEKIQPGSGKIVIKNSDQTVFEIFDVDDGRVNFSDNSLILDPEAVFEPATDYFVLIDPSAVEDLSGNRFAGLNKENQLNFSTVKVLINEIVTDPQQDWSTEHFSGIVGDGNISNVDEWIELYMVTSGIDLTSWTIELKDGSDITGDLTNSGAFDISNYSSSGDGSFTNTRSGDYLILGNPDGSGAMNNKITIILRDPKGAIVDEVRIGEEGAAPSGNARDKDDESVERKLNGIDSGVNKDDFQKGPSTLGRSNENYGYTILNLPSSLVVNETGASVAFDIVLDDVPNHEVFIDVTSENPEEVATSPSSLSFNSTNWNMPQSVTVTGVDDDLIDGTQTVEVKLSVNTEASDDEFDALPVKTISIENADNDVAGFTVSTSAGQTSVTESGTTDDISVVLTAQPESEVLIEIISLDEGEVILNPSSLSFNDTNWNMPQSVTVTGVDDDLVDGTQTVDVKLSVNTEASDDEFDALPVKTISIENADNDVAGFTVSASAGQTLVTESGTTDDFSVVLTAQPESEVLIEIISLDEGEVILNPSSLSFNDTNWNKPQSVTVTGVDDNLIDGTQTVDVKLSVNTEASDDEFDALPVKTISIENADNDVAGFTVSASAGQTSVTESGTTDDFSVVLTAQPESEVLIEIISLDEGEVILNPSSLSFNDTNWNMPQSVTVTGVDDNLVDGTQTVDVKLSVNTEASDDEFDALPVKTISIENADNDVAGFTVSTSAGQTLVTESGTTDDFSVVLTAQPESEVLIEIISLDEGEVILNPSSLSFNDTNWNMPQSVTVTGVDDDLVDGTQTVDVKLSVNTEASDDEFDALPVKTISIENADNDVAGFTVSASAGQTLVTESGTTDDFSVVLTAQPESEVLIEIISLDEGEVILNPSSLSFNDTNWNMPQSVTVTGVDDNLVDGTQTVDVKLSVNAEASDDEFDALPVKTISIENADEDISILSFASSGSSGLESIQSSAVHVINSSANSDTVLVKYKVSGTSNGHGIDHSLTEGELVFIPNDLSEIIEIEEIVDDQIVELDETIIITMFSPVNAILGDETEFIYLIKDDDNATVELANLLAKENSTLAVTMTLDKAVDGGFSLALKAVENTAKAGIDFNAKTEDTVVFKGEINEQHTMEIEMLEDSIVEPIELIDILVSKLKSTKVNSDKINVMQKTTLRLHDNDSAALTIEDKTVNEADSIIELSVILNNAVEGGLTIDLITDELSAEVGKDYEFSKGKTLKFEGRAGEDQEFTIRLVNDRKKESDEVFAITMDNLHSSASSSIDISDGAIITIIDDDQDDIPPKGYTISFDDALIGASELKERTVTLENAEIGAFFSYVVNAEKGDNTISGNGVVLTSTEQIILDDLSVLKDGKLTMSLTLTDTAGNTGVTAFTTARLDTSQPLVPIISAISQDTGESNLDASTSDDKPDLIGKAEPDSEVEVLSNGLSFGIVKADSTGHWVLKYPLAEALNDGYYSFSAKATDEAGNKSHESEVFNVVIDTKPPQILLSSQGPEFINNHFTVDLTYDEEVFNLSADDLFITNASIMAFNKINETSSWSFTVQPRSDGEIRIYVKPDASNDEAGNKNLASNELYFMADSTPPELIDLKRAEPDQLHNSDTDAKFMVVFSEDVTGIDLRSFNIVTTGTATGKVNAINQVNPQTYLIQVNSIAGQGKFGLALNQEHSIIDAASNALIGAISGEMYSINWLPTVIELTNKSINENNDIGALIGDLTTIDLDVGDKHSYMLVEGAGDRDNSSFLINESSLLANESFDYELKNKYSIRLRTDDGHGGIREQRFNLVIENELEPSIFITGENAFGEVNIGSIAVNKWSLVNNGELPLEVRVTRSISGFRVFPGAVMLPIGEQVEIETSFIPEREQIYQGSIHFSYKGGLLTREVSGQGVRVTDISSSLVEISRIIFPNPVDEVLYLNLKSFNDKVKVYLLSAEGDLLETKSSNSDSVMKINMTLYPNGLYLLRLVGLQERIEAKVMINR